METIGRYRITRKLGEGGMGVVYAAHDDRLDRPVAIKRLRGDMADENGRERLWREARLAASISHPNVCQLFEIAEHDGELFIAMELLQGEPLSTRIARGPIPAAEVASIACEMLAALHVLHERGLVHRDLKPSNLFLTPYGVKLLDFGLTRPHSARPDDAPHVTMTGTIVGTPSDMAPEAFAGDAFDRRVDVFAAGVILYEMLAGRQPFAGRTTADVLRAVLSEDPRPIGGSAEMAAMDRVIRRALEKRADSRYPTAAAMAEAVRSAQTGGPLRSGTVPLPASRPALTRLIVLPFRMQRPDAEVDFLAFSLADAITNSLSGLGSLVVRSMLVANRFNVDAPDVRQIAVDADVDVVLTGSLLRAGPQLRVSSQLTEVPHGSVLWSETSQVALDDVFQLQDVLARRIVESLSLPLTAREHRMLAHDVPSNAKAYEAYLRANQLSNDAQNWAQARSLYGQCLEADPQYAPAWARLGRIHRMLGKYDDDAGRGHVAEAEHALQRALEINPDLPLAHSLYAQLEIDHGRATEAMVRLLERAAIAAADPEIFTALVSTCRFAGLLDVSLVAHERARRLEAKVKTSVAQTYFQLGRYDRVVEVGKESSYICAMSLIALGRLSEAAAHLAKPLEKATALMRPLLQAAHAAALGQQADAIAALRAFLAHGFKDPEARYYAARQLASYGETADALRALEEAINLGFFGFPTMARDPWLDPLRASDAFARIVTIAEDRHRDACQAFRDAGGERVLGVTAGRLEA